MTTDTLLALLLRPEILDTGSVTGIVSLRAHRSNECLTKTCVSNGMQRLNESCGVVRNEDGGSSSHIIVMKRRKRGIRGQQGV